MLKIMKQSDTILNEIFAYMKKQLEEKEARIPLKKLENKIDTKNVRDFKKAITKDPINIIAEIKKKSPSKGIIKIDFDHKKIAKEYEKAKVNAISVLTEPKYFAGVIIFLRDVKILTSVPVFRKDFIFDPYQIYETRFYGADAFLLIASILTKDELKSLIKLGNDLKMNALVEAHTAEELDLALEAGAEIIGINNRDLHNFSEDISIFERLAPRVPKDKILVAESAIKTVEDVKRMQQAGANAVLVGTAFMQAKDIEKTIRGIRAGI